ncbi:MAG: Protocatechuate 3,4-dioxygenase beta chain, partial [uncultured Rubrobacteraceae bacterium]
DAADHRGGGRAPAVPLPRLQVHAPAGAEGAARHPAEKSPGRYRPGPRARQDRCHGRRPDPPARRRASGGEDHLDRPRPGRRRTPGPKRPRRGLAGERRGPLHPPERPASRPARPELLRRGTLPHGRRGPLPLRHGQAGGVPVEEPRQRLATGPRSFLGVRFILQEPADHPDVLPRRPALRARPHLPVRKRPRSPTAHDLLPRPRNDRTRMGFGLPLRHRPRRPRRHPVREAARV